MRCLLSQCCRTRRVKHAYMQFPVKNDQSPLVERKHFQKFSNQNCVIRQKGQHIFQITGEKKASQIWVVKKTDCKIPCYLYNSTKTLVFNLFALGKLKRISQNKRGKLFHNKIVFPPSTKIICFSDLIHKIHNPLLRVSKNLDY